MDVESLPKYFPLWDDNLTKPILSKIKIVSNISEIENIINLQHLSLSECTNYEENEKILDLITPIKTSYPNNKNNLRCSHCNITFEAREDQVKHYNTKWHRLNAKRIVQGLSLITLDQFDELSEDEEDDFFEDEEDGSSEEETTIRSSPKVYFTNENNDVFSIYKLVLLSKKHETESDLELIHHIVSSPKKLNWAILMCAGGHFAAAIFNRGDIVAHKTFHSYTVRAKQGGSQSARDNKSASSHPRSAGASLRRYNEKAYNEHVSEFLSLWKEQLAACHLIFYRCPKTNMQLLFGGGAAYLKKDDQRMRTIPFPTKQPSFAEVKRVHKTLACFSVHGKCSDLMESPREKSPNKSVNENQMISTSKSKKSKSKKRKDGQKENILTEEECERKELIDLVYSACTKGHLDVLKQIVYLVRDEAYTDTPSSFSDSVVRSARRLSLDEFFALPIDADENTMLHVVAQKNFKEVIVWLLANECDPCLTNSRKQSAVEANWKQPAAEKHFRKFRAHHPLMYDYDKAGIGSPWTQLDEERELKRMAEQAKKKEERNEAKKKKQREMREAERKKKEEEKQRMREEEERNKEEELKIKEEQRKKREEKRQKEKFTKLSDREKRALAAERRMKENCVASGAGGPECAQCNRAMGSSPPFTYFDFKFCSTACVKQHRAMETRN